MKRIVLLIIVIFCYYITSLYCQDTENMRVTIKDGQFYLGEEAYFPRVLNFGITITADERGECSKLYLSSDKRYGIDVGFDCEDAADCEKKLKDEFARISAAGYDALRIVGMSFSYHDMNWDPEIEEWTNEPMLFCACQNCPWPEIDTFYCPVGDYSILLDLVGKMLDYASESSLKIIYLIKENCQQTPSAYEKFNHEFALYLDAFCRRFRDHPALMALDFYNEPIWKTWKLDLGKDRICYDVENWQSIVDDNAPEILTTIGLQGSIELSHWDPHCLACDFISFHPYSTSKNLTTYEAYVHGKAVKREIKWFNQAVKKPWIIGETSFSAGYCDDIPCDVCHGDYYEQAQFVESTIDYCYRCNGLGYSWWLARDMVHKTWDNKCQDPLLNWWFYGIFEYDITPKYASYKMTSYNPSYTPRDCPEIDYYNEFYDLYPINSGENSTVYIVEGKVYNRVIHHLGEPIADAYVEGFAPDEDYGVLEGITRVSYSQRDGSYRIKANAPITRIRASCEGGTSIEKTFSLDDFRSEGNMRITHVDLPLCKLQEIEDDVVISGAKKDAKAWNAIYVNNVTVKSGEKMELHAGQRVKLSPYFQVRKGGYFKASCGGIHYDCDDLGNICDHGDEIGGDLNESIDPQTYNSIFENGVTIFPNPSHGVVNISLIAGTEHQTKVFIYDSYSKFAAMKEFTGSGTTLDLNGYKPGLYFIKVENNGALYTEKLVLLK